MTIVPIQFEIDLSRDMDPWIFPAEIEENHWIAFHGSSSHAEASIENDGPLRWRPSVITLDDVTSVAKVYESIDWSAS